jgi:type II secretory pathway pseudopilin PulG
MKHISRLKGRKPAFTLVEILIGVAITMILCGGVAAAVAQTSSTNASAGAATSAIRQADTTIDRMRQDILMAQRVTTGGPSGFPLTLSWKDWDNTTCTVTYLLQGSQLIRGVSVNGGPRSDSVIAADVSLIRVNNLPYLSGNLSISLTIEVSGFRSATESRTFEVLPRTGT